jgi:hypothetical protein
MRDELLAARGSVTRKTSVLAVFLWQMKYAKMFQQINTDAALDLLLPCVASLTCSLIKRHLGFYLLKAARSRAIEQSYLRAKSI